MINALTGELKYNWAWFALGIGIFLVAFAVSFFLMSGKTFIALSSVVPIVPVTLIPSSMSIYMKQKRERLHALLPVKTQVVYFAKLGFMLVQWLEVVMIFAIFHLLVFPSVPLIIVLYRCAALSATMLYITGVWILFAEFSFNKMRNWLRTLVALLLLLTIIFFLFLTSIYLYDDMLEQVEKFQQPLGDLLDIAIFSPAGVVFGHVISIALIIAGYLMFTKRTTFTGVSENKFMGF